MVKREKNKELFSIRNNDVMVSVNKLENLIRTEYNTKTNFLEYYADKDNIKNVDNIKNQIIYGRRGTGKTHLLRALQETIIDNKDGLPVYIDFRPYIPVIRDDDSLYIALIIFKQIIIEILKVAYENIEIIYNINSFELVNDTFINSKKAKILKYLEEFNTSFNGTYFTKIGEVEFDKNEVKKLATSLNISTSPHIKGDGLISNEVKNKDVKIKYLSFTEMVDILNNFISEINTERIYCLLDEWSEIPVNTQCYLAELLKRVFITQKITIKIAAIPNRTKLKNELRIGLEDGGDIFGYSLDNRYIYEMDQETTKKFFNELLFNQLFLVSPQIFDVYKTRAQNFLNIFLANQALREILIASAGIPRDFLNIFIGAYNNYNKRRTDNKHMALTDVRSATILWYNVDKKKNVDSNHCARILLDKIIQEILLKKKRCHFLIPEKYENNKELNDLIDMRVIHLRKKGISHKGKPGISYNVYYIDYACYTSSNMYHNKINNSLLNEIESTDNFREIRRVSLEDNFFDQLNLEIGNGFLCPHCGNTVDTNHMAYIKKGLCNNCFEKI